MTNCRDTFPFTLKRLLAMGGYAQRDLAEYCECATSTVSMWMHGKSYPEAKYLNKIASFFQVPVFELLSGEDQAEEILLRTFRVLSSTGKAKALERMEELKQLYWYEKDTIAKDV